MATLPIFAPPLDHQGGYDSITAFLRELYGGATEGHIALWTLPSKVTHWYPCGDIGGIAADALVASEAENVYFGVGLQARPLGPNLRGQQETVCAIPGLWVDFDVKGPAHSSPALPPTVEEALALVNQFPLKPSLVVMSGHGLQAYWLFREIWQFASDDERARARALSDGFQQIIRKYAEERGWSLDHTADLSRVLRLPGTFNRKLTPVEVRVIDSYPERRYNPSEFDDFIAQAPQEFRSPIRKGDYPPAMVAPILDGCGWMRHCHDDAATLPEPEWYAMLSILGRCQNGPELAHEYSRPHPKYTARETTAKAYHAVTAAGPSTCGYICQRLNDSYCGRCENRGRVRSPIVLGVRRNDEDVQSAGLREAQQFIDAWLPRLNQNPADAFAEEFLEAASLLERNEAAWIRLRDSIKKFPAIEWGRFKKALKSKQRVVSPKSELAPVATDVPIPDLVLPKNYVLGSDYTARLVSDGNDVHEEIFAYTPVIIGGLLSDSEENTEFLRLGYKRGERWRYLIADRGVALNGHKLVELASCGFPVAGENAAHLAAYLHRLEALNHQRFPSYKVSSHLGWQGKRGGEGFLLGRTLIDSTGEIHAAPELDELFDAGANCGHVVFRGLGSGDEQIADGFHTKGTLAGWVDVVRLVEPYNRVLLGLYASFVPPLLEIFGIPNFVIDWCGRTTVGKTTTQRVAASVWGLPDERADSSAIASWDATKVFIERASAVISGLPLILDDTKRAKDPRVVADMLYLVANGKGRGRGNTKSLARTRAFRTVMLSSGEAPATSFTEDGGTRTRCIQIRGLPFLAADDSTTELVNRINLNLQLHYGHAGQKFVQYLLQHRDRWDEWAAKYNQIATEYMANATSEQGRMAKYAAAIVIAGQIAHAALDLPWEFRDPIKGPMWAEVAADAKDAAGAERALLDVKSWADAHQEWFYGRHRFDRESNPIPPTSGWAGRWDKEEAWDFIGFHQTQLRDILRDCGYEPEAILLMWLERKWLDVEEGRRGYTKRFRAGAEKPYLIAVKRNAIEEVERQHE